MKIDGGGDRPSRRVCATPTASTLRIAGQARRESYDVLESSQWHDFQTLIAHRPATTNGRRENLTSKDNSNVHDSHPQQEDLNTVRAPLCTLPAHRRRVGTGPAILAYQGSQEGRSGDAGLPGGSQSVLTMELPPL